MHKDHHSVIETYLPGTAFEVRGNTLLVPTEPTALAQTIHTLMKDHAFSLTVMFAADERKTDGAFHIYYVFGVPHRDLYIVPTLKLAGTVFPSLARQFPGLALYEREIHTMFGLTPEGHPDLRSLILHEENWPADTYPMRKDFAWNTQVPETHAGDYTYHHPKGEGIYEVPVGPVHAGIIEPGHFRFSVAGEAIIQLEPRLGWVHKGVEKVFEALPMDKRADLAEHISSDSSFAHSLAFCQAVEKLTETKVPERAQYLRVVYAELERITMHIFDIGNIAGNGTGFSFMSSQGFRLTEVMRRMSQSLVGNRFWRRINTPGGVTHDLTAEQIEQLRKTLSAFEKDFTEIIDVADASASLINRLKGTGTLSQKVALVIGALGIGARAVGIARDTRIDHPYAAYGKIVPQIQIEEAGDVQARFQVRIKEVYESLRIIEEALAHLPSGSIAAKLGAIPTKSMAVSAIEGRIGETVYVVMSEEGALSRVKVRDASFINWQLFPHMVGTDMIPDFPLINKSLNLSYTGNDL